MKHRSIAFTVISLFFILTGFAQHSYNLDPVLKPFYHGVASGDPLPDAVIIWTRVTPDTGFTGPIQVSWQMALDTGITQVVQSGSFTTDQSMDYTVKVDVTGLQPGTWYFYEFAYNGHYSLRGRTRTAPSGNTDSLRFAVMSCANFEAGYFNVYHMAKERNDIDAVIHLGDYIYEYETGGYAPNPNANREWEPTNEIINLNDYRTRYAYYHLDNDLRELHQQYPWIIVWDDHESANDAWRDGAQNHTDPQEGAWVNRKSYATQAFMEWLPVRPPQPGNNQLIYREFNYGNLMELFMLDTRLHDRDEQSGTTGNVVNDTNRTLLGPVQWNWLKSGITNTSSRWKILGQQVMFAPLKLFGVAINEDQWDGYPAERQRVMDYVLQHNIEDIVVLTGDIHCSWGNDVPGQNYNSTTGAGSAFVEFVTPSVTSPGFPIGVPVSTVQLFNSHAKFIDLVDHGYLILDVNMQRAQSDWFYTNTLDDTSSQCNFAQGWYVNHQERFLRQAVSASVPRAELNHIQAPELPRIITNFSLEALSEMITGIYPNPADQSLFVQFFMQESSPVDIEILDVSGKTVYTERNENPLQGMNLWYYPLDYPAGNYVLKIVVNGKLFSERFLIAQ